MKKLSKSEAEKEIKEFFKNIKSKTPKEVKKIKKMAMRYSIKLGEKRKLFCKKCFSPYNNRKIRIKRGMRIISCKDCGYISRWKINSS